jgi:hypothetical protein
MKKLRLLVAGLFILPAVFSACSGDDEGEASSLGGSPEENNKVFMNIMASSESPVMGMYLDANQLLEKSGARKDAQMGVMLEGALKQMEGMGVNLDSRIMVFAEGKSVNDAVVLLMGSLSDGEKFSATIKSQVGADISEEDGLYFAKISLPQMQVGDLSMAFNDNLFVAAFATNSMSKDGLKEILKRGGEEAESKDAVLSQFLSSKDDFGMFMKYDKLMGLVPKELMNMQAAGMNPAMNLDNMLSYYENAWTNLSVNFNVGAIEFAAVSDFPKISGYKMFADKPLPADFANFATPNGQVFAWFGGAFNGEAFMKYLSDANLMADLNSQIPAESLDLMKLFTGEFAISIFSVPQNMEAEASDADVSYSFEMLDEEASKENSPEMKPEAESDFRDYIAVVGINDAEGKLAGIMDTVKNMKKVGDYYTMNDKVFYILLGNKLVVTGNAEVATEIARNQMLQPSSVVKQYLMNPMSGFVDMEMGAEEMVKTMDPQQKMILGMISKLHVEGTMQRAVFRVEMKDRTMNALEAFVKMAAANMAM